MQLRLSSIGPRQLSAIGTWRPSQGFQGTDLLLPDSPSTLWWLIFQAHNNDLYQGSIQELAAGVSRGLNGTVFAYGERGSRPVTMQAAQSRRLRSVNGWPRTNNHQHNISADPKHSQASHIWERLAIARCCDLDDVQDQLAQARHIPWLVSAAAIKKAPSPDMLTWGRLTMCPSQGACS